jgi:hypothetical protein
VLHTVTGTESRSQGQQCFCSIFGINFQEPPPQAKNNPQASAKLKKERRDNAENYMSENGRTGILSDHERNAIVLQKIGTGKTLFKDSPDTVRYTRRTLQLEGMAWITPRGSRGGTTRPVLAWKKAKHNGKTNITAVEARTAYTQGGLGFTSVTLWSGTEMLNATYVEDRLQQRYHELGLPRRLHRNCGKGGNGYNDRPETGERVHQVVLAYSSDVDKDHLVLSLRLNDPSVPSQMATAPVEVCPPAPAPRAAAGHDALPYRDVCRGLAEAARAALQCGDKQLAAP